MLLTGLWIASLAQCVEKTAAHDQKPGVSLSVTEEKERIHARTRGQAGGSLTGEWKAQERKQHAEEAAGWSGVRGKRLRWRSDCNEVSIIWFVSLLTCLCVASVSAVFSSLEPEAQSIISQEKNPMCDGDTGFYNVELRSTQVSCLGVPLCHVPDTVACDCS